MSGNTIRFGIDVARADWHPALAAGYPVPFFVLGAAAGAAVPERMRGFSLFVEAVLIAIFTLLALRLHLTDPASAPGLATFAGCGALLVFAFALQNAVLRQRGGGVMGTTFISGMLANIGSLATAAIVQSRRNDPEAAGARGNLIRCSAMFGGYLAGGVCGAAAFLAWSLPAFIVPIALLALAGAVDLRLPEADE